MYRLTGKCCVLQPHLHGDGGAKLPKWLICLEFIETCRAIEKCNIHQSSTPLILEVGGVGSNSKTNCMKWSDLYRKVMFANHHQTGVGVGVNCKNIAKNVKQCPELHRKIFFLTL